MKYFIKTFGCQMNISDSEKIAYFLEKKGLKKASELKEANLVVVNSCSVRQMAEDRVYGFIHNLWKNFPQKKIILTGCLAKRKDVQNRLKKKVGLFLSINEFFQAKRLKLFQAQSENKNNSPGDKNNCPSYLSFPSAPESSFQAYVPIMTGCNNFCSYCVVPSARGREYSRPADEIIKEIRELIKKGYKEIILLGQNVNSYCGIKSLKLRKRTLTFPQLLKKINALPGNFWINFLSNHPKDFSEELIETVTRLEKVCEHIHLPLQSGADKILEKMNRHYTTNYYLRLIKKIKASFQKNKPQKLYSLTSDIIIGFPGETKKQFLGSAKIMKKASFDMVYFGQYSPRPETAAQKMKETVSKKEKKCREKFLNEILKKTADTNNQKYLRKILEVLVDKKENKTYYGHTRTLKNVKVISAKKNLVGKIIKATITKANPWNLEANY